MPFHKPGSRLRQQTQPSEVEDGKGRIFGRGKDHMSLPIPGHRPKSPINKCLFFGPTHRPLVPALQLIRDREVLHTPLARSKNLQGSGYLL